MSIILKKSKIKRILASLILLLYLVSAETTTVFAYGNASQVQQDYISLMRGNSITELGDSIYSYDDLRNIALFLSNSYVPFYTSLDADSEDGSKAKSVAMLRQIGFSKDSAEQVVDEIYTASLDSASQVYVDFQELGDVVSNDVRFVHSVGRTRPHWTGAATSVVNRFAQWTPQVMLGGLIYDQITGGDFNTEVQVSNTTSCIVSGGETSNEAAVAKVGKTLSDTVKAIGSAIYSGVKTVANKLESVYHKYFDKVDAVSGQTYWGESYSDSARCNTDAIGTALSTIKHSLMDAGIPEQNIDFTDIVANYGWYEYPESNSRVNYDTTDGKNKIITTFLDIPPSLLTTINRSYVYKQPSDAKSNPLKNATANPAIFHNIDTVLGLKKGTFRIVDDTHNGLFWSEDDIDEIGESGDFTGQPFTFEVRSNGKLDVKGGGNGGDNNKYSIDRSYSSTLSKGCMFGSQLAVSVRTGKNSYVLFLCQGYTDSGKFYYSDIVSYSPDTYTASDSPEKKGWQYGTSDAENTAQELNAVIPGGTMGNEGYTSAVRDDNLADQFTPLTLYMFMNILDNMSRDNIMLNKQGAFDNKSAENTGYKNGTQQYPVRLYYRENLRTIPCGQIDDWLLQILYYVSSHTDYSDRKAGKLGSYIVNGSLENFLDKENEVITDQDNLESLMSLFQNMYVDWVGNILVDQGDQRVVVVPACLNSYAFTTLESKGGTSMRELIPAQASTENYIGGRTATGENKWKNTNDYYKRLNKYDGVDYPFVPLRNLDSVLGIKMIMDSKNKYVDTSQTGKITFKSMGEKATNQAILPMVMERGQTKVPSWDFKNTPGTAGGKKLAETLRDEYGFIAYDAENNKWTKDNNIILLARQHTCEKPADQQEYEFLSYYTYMPEFLVYKAIRQSKDNSNTEFVLANLVDLEGTLDDYTEAEFFSQTANTLKIDDKFDFNLDFTSQDSWMLQNLYLTYTMAYINGEEYNGTSATFNSSINYVNMKFNDVFPKKQGLIEWDVTEIMDESIREFTYYFLHPTKGLAYVATWFKNKIAGIFLKIHEDIVGASDSNASTGMTRYLSFSGYVTTPALGDIDWISSFVNAYNDIIVYLIIIMMLIILCFILANNITLQRGIIGFIAFAFLAFMPPALINFTIDASNKLCDCLYGQKFNYWAIVQTNEYIGALADVEDAEGTTDYIAALYKATATSTGDVDTGGENQSGYSGVKIKWLAPKKYNELGAFSDEIMNRIKQANSGLSGWTLSNLVVGQQNATSAEFYVDSDSATYIYRDILDIYRYGSSSYYMNLNNQFFADNPVSVVDRLAANSDKIGGEDFTDVNGVKQKNKLNNTTSLRDNLLSSQKGAGGSSSVPSGLADCSSLTYVRKGFLTDTPNMIGEDGNVTSANKNYFNTALATSNLYIFGKNGTSAINLIRSNYDRFIEAYKNGTIQVTPDNICLNTTNQAVKHGCNFGIDQDYFKFGINELVSDQITDDEASFYQYALYSESPYYYFSYNLRDQARALHNYAYDYSSDGLTQNTKMYHMLLDDNQAYFFNYNVESGDGYGELRDFMNFHDLFYYVIPALNSGNDLVNAWAQLYGMTPSTDISLKLDVDGYITYNGEKYDSIENEELKKVLSELDNESLYNFWLNYNIRTIYNCYSSWLYAMKSCDYSAKPETIHVAGEKFLVSNPLDPYSYNRMENGELVEGRYMIFSRSEQKYYGLLDSDLTEVERKLLAVEDAVYADSLSLMNYYTICDENFIQSLALMELFAFNKEFSESTMFGSSFPLYPQTYELKAFTYDAYLRMIVAGSMEKNSQGERLQTTTRNEENKSIYERVQENTSIFFSIILIISDILAVYVIPTLKIFFICILFFVSILVIISAVTGIETPGGGILQAFWKSLIAPLASFFIISVGMAFIIALFMSNGSDNITSVSRLPRIALGDPTTTILAVTLINFTACVLYFKVIKKMFADLKTYFKTVFDNIGAAITGTVKKVGGAILAGQSLRALRNMANGTSRALPTGTPSIRGKDNVKAKPKAIGSSGSENGSGGNSALTDAAAGAAGGAAGAVLGKTAADKVIDAHQKQSKEDKQLDKLANREAQLNKEKEQLENRHNDKIIGDKNYAKQKARLEKKSRKNDKKLDRLADKVGAKDDRAKATAAFKQNKANNIAKYGRLGAIKANTRLTASHIKDSANSRVQGMTKSLGRMKGDISNGVTSVKKGASSVVSGAKSVGGKVQKFATNGHYREHVVDSAKGAVVNSAKSVVSATANAARSAASSASQIASDAGATYRKTSHAEMSSATRSRIIDRKTGRNSTRKS